MVVHYLEDKEKTKLGDSDLVLEWYQKLSKFANSVTEISSSALSNYSALSAVNLNKDGSLLTARPALNSTDRNESLTVFGEEIDRLIKTQIA